MRFRRAFTLIELLVVVSIVTLLLTLTLPVLGQARKVARTAMCLANLHQLALATQAYLVEQRSFYPRPFDSPDGWPGASAEEVGRACWFNALDPYLQQPRRDYADGDPDERNYHSVKQDPIWSSELSSGEEPDRINRTLKMNEYFRWDAESPFVRETQVDRRDRVVLYFDGRARDVHPTDVGSASRFAASPGRVALRHGSDQSGRFASGSANVAFTDGSAATVTQQVRLDTAAPSWHLETRAYRNAGWQTLSWRLREQLVPN